MRNPGLSNDSILRIAKSILSQSEVDVETAKIKRRILNDIDNREDLDDLMTSFGLELPGETYQETADRLREEGEDAWSDVFDTAELMWFKLNEQSDERGY